MNLSSPEDNLNEQAKLTREWMLALIPRLITGTKARKLLWYKIKLGPNDYFFKCKIEEMFIHVCGEFWTPRNTIVLLERSGNKTTGVQESIGDVDVSDVIRAIHEVGFEEYDLFSNPLSFTRESLAEKALNQLSDSSSLQEAV